MGDRVNYAYPIQHVQRDLPAAALLASQVLQPGERFYLARAGWILHRAKKWRNSTVFWGVAPTQLSALKLLSGCGARIVGFCDEALASDHDYYRATKASASCLELTDAFVLWSRSHRSTIHDRLSLTDALEVGSPRIDILFRTVLRPPQLVVFASNGHFPFSPRYVCSQSDAENYVKSHLLPQFPTLHASQVATRLRQASENGRALLEALQILSAQLPEQQFVLRLRFGDDRKAARTWIRSENVRMQHSGPVNDVLGGARLWVHSDCTSGAEACALGIASLNFIPHGGTMGLSDVLPAASLHEELVKAVISQNGPDPRDRHASQVLRDDLFNGSRDEPIRIVRGIQSLSALDFSGQPLVPASRYQFDSAYTLLRAALNLRSPKGVAEQLTKEAVARSIQPLSPFSVERLGYSARTDAVCITRTY